MSSFMFPSEGSKHTGTLMNWPTTSSIIGSGWSYEGADVAATRREIANVVRTIAKYEPVKVFVRDPKTYDDYGDSGYEEAKSLLGNERNVEMHICPHVDSLWTRDTGPVFVRSKDGKSIENDWTTANAGVDRCCKDHLSSSTVVGAVLSFNQWGRKLLPSPESYLASTICRTLNISSVLAPFIGEGGGIEMDGEGTLIATESSLLNPNRNPGISRERLESYFSWIFGVSKTIWVPGKRGHDITDDHIDALARFSGKPGVVLLSRAFVPADTSRQKQAEIESTYLSAKKIIENETDASGRHLTTVTVPEPDPAKVLGSDYHPESGPSVSYVNFLIVNDAVVMAEFGDDKADTEAARVIGDQFPGRRIEQVYLHQLPMQGGGIHCASQQYYL